MYDRADMEQYSCCNAVAAGPHSSTTCWDACLSPTLPPYVTRGADQPGIVAVLRDMEAASRIMLQTLTARDLVKDSHLAVLADSVECTLAAAGIVAFLRTSGSSSPSLCSNCIFESFLPKPDTPCYNADVQASGMLAKASVAGRPNSTTSRSALSRTDRCP